MGPTVDEERALKGEHGDIHEAHDDPFIVEEEKRKQPTNAQSSDTLLKWSCLALLVVQNSGTFLLTRYTRTLPGPMYRTTIVVLMVEVAKMIFCIGCGEQRANCVRRRHSMCAKEYRFAFSACRPATILALPFCSLRVAHAALTSAACAACSALLVALA
eukprot:6176819-Pleurochrysis_carterae.AAC.1